MAKDWQFICTYPKWKGPVRHAEVRMWDATTKPDVHWACDLNGEEQPPFKGWFEPVRDSGGRVCYFRQVEEPMLWRDRAN